MTPVQPITIRVGGRPRTILLKLEGCSPAGSIKGRTARSLVDALEADERVRPGVTLIESTSGNLGVGLALVAAARGYRFHAVVDPKTSPIVLTRMRRLGADIERVTQADEHGAYLPARIARVLERCASSSAFVWTDQYGSEANPRVHETETAPELAAQAGCPDAVFAAVSTGGTVAGLARYFRTHHPFTRTVAVDVPGSVALGGSAGPRLLTGIGSATRSRFVTHAVVDDVVIVPELQAIATCRRIRSERGIALGGSSGAVIAACTAYLQRHPDIERAVCVCPDGGENYTDTIYDDAWLARHSIRLTSPDPGPRLAAS